MDNSYLSTIKVLLVIPCYNEEFRLKSEAFLQFGKDNPNVHFLFVNDGSQDQTIKVIEELSKKMQHFSFLSLEKNVGKAEAIRSGVLANKGNTENYEFIGYLDADLSVPLAEISDFLSILQKNKNIKFLMGARLARLGANIKRKKRRHYLGRIFATFVSSLLNEPVYDTQCGIKLIHKSVVFELFKEEFISKWLFDVELLFRWKAYFPNNVNMIYEHPLSKWTDIPGSKLKLGNFLYAPIELFIIWNKYRKL
ncbi:glycosyl transferase [Aequorivita sublithincola DSM 14238]|uniref:Glycosyl transferase n=1 Tax=Aequorivita sublithincola (strain DSM 14238 / LMG 21431 / ACAM 643 / 9-3) TaxID=746697 RepID=I3YXU8_AEQSU|nr:glycosyltransferase [Aequorivita sublithincola]AFL81816.1 glycosyl transferase [Aequorivita sublithincola DSM 14238]